MNKNEINDTVEAIIIDLTYINEEVPFFLRSVKKGMNSYRKYGIINSVVGSQNDKYFA